MRMWDGGFKMKFQLMEGVLSGRVHFLYIRSLVNKIFLVSLYVNIHSIIVLWNTTKIHRTSIEENVDVRFLVVVLEDIHHVNDLNRKDTHPNTLPSRCDILVPLLHIHRAEQFSTCPFPNIHSLDAGRQHSEPFHG